MSSLQTNHLEQRILLLAPTKRDAEVTASFLATAGLTCVACQDLQNLCKELKNGCGTLLLTEEVIALPNIKHLIDELDTQPAWSDLPVVMLMRGGIQSSESNRLLRLLGNVTLLERPAPSRSVVSAVQTGVRGRNRQYQAREQISLIQEAQSRYRDLQLQLRIAVDASQLGTFHCEMPLGKIIWNTRCKEHFWLPPNAEVDFDLFYSILHPDDRERARAAVEACVYQAKPYDIEYRTVSPKGDIRWVRATGRTFFDDQGKPLRFDGTTQDITERRRAAEEREQLLQSEQAARAELERAGRMKDEFLATLSHELRTPLNAILGWSQLLRQDHDPATVAEGLEIIERNARVQVQLIEDLLDMSRIISGKVRLNVQPTDPTAFISAAIETVRPSARARGIQLESVFDPRVGLIAGDANRMQQVVWNLLSNAIKFTPPGGKVSVALRRRDSNIEIAVSDTGQGIAANFLPHVFERFRQADSSSTRPHGGLGLGLAIVKQIMELHGGTIAAASEGAGRGSVFTATLPVLATDRDASNDDSKKPASPFGKPAFKEKVLDGMTVLVVDDEMDARGLTQRVLEECGAHVVTAASAMDAIDKLSAIKPDVLVSDIGMPEVDGYELLRRVRALGGSHGGDVPAIALTAFARSEDRARALLAGYRVHVSKPVHPHELVATVASVGGRSGDLGDG